MSKLLSVMSVLGLAVLTGWAQEVPRVELPHRASQEPGAAELAHRTETLVVPSDTHVRVEMLSGIHTKINRADDNVTARLMQPVYVNGRVALPSGSILDGHITMIRSSGFVHRPAELRLRFDKIVLPDGQAQPIVGVIAGMDQAHALDLRIGAEGHLIGGRAFSWKTLLGGAGLAGFGAIRAAAVGATAVSAGFTVVGAAAMGYEILLPKGREVNLPPETRCLVRLNYPLTVRVSW